MKRIFFSVVLFLCLIFAFTAKSDSGSITEVRTWAEYKGAQILEILANKNLEQKYAALDKILYEDIDLNYAARFVVGRYWRQMSEEQKQIYVPLFKRYVAALYKSFPLDVPEGSIGYKIEKIIPSDTFYDVICSIDLAQQNSESKAENSGKIGVLFSLVKNNEKIVVRDLKIAASSLLVTYRERFEKMIHQDSDDEIDWFLEDLTTITEDKERENELKLIKN